MKSSILTISLLLVLSMQAEAKTSSRVASSRKGMRVMNRTVAPINTSTTTTSTEEEEEKTKEVCEQLVYECMDSKADEFVMQNEVYYDDYNDMLTDIYGGMTNPAFKCIYDSGVKDLYSEYYYGQTNLEPSSNPAKIRKNSIEYYKFIKQNANDVASKKIAVNMVLPEVLTIAGITITPTGMQSQSIPEVSYKFTTLNQNVNFEEIKNYCMDPTKNEELEGCPKLKKSIGDNWKTLSSNSISKSCQDYETFLIDKRSKAKKEAETFIIGLKTKISNNIEEYNAKIEASKQLKF